MMELLVARRVQEHPVCQTVIAAVYTVDDVMVMPARFPRDRRTTEGAFTLL